MKNTHTTRKLAVRAIALAIAAAFAPLTSHANPVGPTVINGTASFATTGNTLAITNSPNAILNWQQFNIGKNETTKFIQQNSQSSVLNRITGQDPSQIFGQLQSNGKVLLLNPNGVLFGPTAKVDVQSLILSNLNLSNADFLAGKYHFTGTSTGALTNQGSITTPMGGSVYLIGSDVANSGIITSPSGEVVLAAGTSVTLGNLNTPELTVTLTADTQKATNLGTITAAGGKIDMYGALVENSGQLKANTVKLLGDTVILTSTADIDVSEVGAGGTALIGGGLAGQEPQYQERNEYHGRPRCQDQGGRD